jgi:hypothetical protein
MAEQSSNTVVRLEGAQATLRDHFLGWQCRLRQLAVRQAGGRPTSGMRPALFLPDQSAAAADITVLIIRREPAETTAEFRHLVQRTNDPAERYDSALKHLAAAYYQRPREFSDELTALFGPRSELVERLLVEDRCALEFTQYQQRYLLPCRVRDLAESMPAFQATYWHNALFNPKLPAGIRILGFQPDWARAEADPPAG